MPSLTFVMPHWLYWSGLVFFPLIAAYLLSRQRRNPPDTRPTLFIAYLFWLLTGYLGIHRFYLKSAWAFVFIPAFVGVVYCTNQVREVRDEMSRTFSLMQQTQTAVAQAKDEMARGTPGASKMLAGAQATARTRTAEYDVAKAVSDDWKGRARFFGITLTFVTLLAMAALLLLQQLVR